MKAIVLLPFLLMCLPQGQSFVLSNDGSQVTVASFKWSRERHAIEDPNAGSTGPAPAMIAANKNYEKNRRQNSSPGERDPNLDTMDGRSAAMEKAVQDSRAPKPVDGFAYRAKVHNASNKVIDVIFWEYRFQETTNPTVASRRQFLCGVSIKPEKDKELQAFSVSGPGDVVSVGTLAKKTPNLFEEKVVINRVEYADGSIWQRKDWNFGEVRLSYARAVAMPWSAEMCRGL